jgi:hypothetical protein
VAEFPGDRSFAEISRSIFRVETSWSVGTAHGTGFVIATFRDSKKLVLATAKHVLKVPDDETVQWRVEQYDDGGKIARSVTFWTSAQLKGNVPYRTHNKIDVGVCVLPALGDDKQPFAREGELPVRTVNILEGASTGTRVGWAGFPLLVEKALGFPQLCYFEGVVSAMIDREDRRLYVVDGHGAKGVSGGPVWHWSADRDRLEVVGIVCEYRHSGSNLPGFCLFEPINPIMYYFETEPWHPDVAGDHLITNRRG